MPRQSLLPATRGPRAFGLAAAIIAAALMAAACGQAASPDKQTTAKPGAAAASAPALLLAAEDLHTVGTGSVSTGPVISGTLVPEKRADLRAEISAVVLQVTKDNGEAVRAGDVLVRLDDSTLRDALNSAEETVRTAKQSVEQAERMVARQKSLRDQGMTSMQALEDAELRVTNAQSELAAAQSRAVNARQQLQRTLVRAPFDGIVGERKASPGDTAAIGKELLKVWDPRSTRFEGLVSADRMSELKVGAPVSFRVNGYPDAEFAGRIQRVDALANAATRQVEVIVAFSERAAAPRVAGLFAEGRVLSGGARAVVVPEAMVQREGEAAQVWRVEGMRLKKVALKLGERDARRGEYPVLEGLAEGDRILRRPGSTLTDGQTVEFASPNGAASATTAPPAPVAAASR